MYRSTLTSLFVLVGLLTASGLSAQSAGSPFVPVGHWSAYAIDRLHALGVTPPGTVRGQRSRSVAEVEAVLEAAAAQGDELARGYLRRFNSEFSARVTSLEHASVAGGAGLRDGMVAPGRYSTWGEENWTGASELEDRTTAIGSIAALAGLGGYAAAGAVISHEPHRTRVDELYGVLGAGPLAVWGGRRLHGFGPGTDGMVMSGSAPIDGGGVYLAEPLRLPWLLRHLGPVRAEMSVALMDPNGPVRRPWFVLSRGSIEPHPRLGFGVTRGGMIGAVDGDRSVGEVLFFLIGGHTGGSEYDNQIAAIDAWFRPPAGPLPLLLYVEWGAEDSAGSWWDVPGIIAGVEVPSVPGAPWLSVLVERTSFEGSNSGNPPWYRHPIGFHDGWTTRGELLGHPLGGHGRQWLVQARADVLEGRLLLVTRGFTRRRGAENLFAPERAGRSTGVQLDGNVQLGRGIGITLDGSLERGDGWRAVQGAAALRIYLPHTGS